MYGCIHPLIVDIVLMFTLIVLWAFYNMGGAANGAWHRRHACFDRS